MRAGVAATLGAGVLLACASLPDTSATAQTPVSRW